MASLRPMCNARSQYFLRERDLNLPSSPSVQDKKRKLSDSAEFDILPKKLVNKAFRKRATAFSTHTKSPLAQVSNQESVKPEMESTAQPDLNSGVTARYQRVLTRSISHLQYQKWQESIKRNRAEHARQMASEPANPIIPSTSEPRFYYEEYQIKVPIEALAAKLEYHECHQRMKDKFWMQAARSRFKKARGLREWEWTFGEPEEDESESESEQSVSGTTEGVVVDNDEGKEQQPPLSYASRMKTFTYTRGDDPMWKGRHYVYSKGKGLRIKKGDRSNEMSQEDDDYIPHIEDNIDMNRVPYSFRNKYINQAEQEHQTCQTAADFLFGGPSRAEQKALEAEEEEKCAGTDTAPQMLDTDAVEAGPMDTQGEGEVVQELGHQRSDSDSGYSVMSDDSDEDDEEDEE